MGGIAGIFNLDGRSVPREDLEAMVRTLAHRGRPSRFWAQGPCVMAQVDVEDPGGDRGIRGPRAPFVWTADASEPSNFSEQLLETVRSAPGAGREICARHRGQGSTSSSPGDDGAADGRWTRALSARTTAEFAAAVWEAELGRLTLLRDPVGVKPLFYGQCAGRLYFASEAKAILAAPGVRCRFDPAKIREFDSFRFRDAEKTFFQGIVRLSAGEELVATSRGITRVPAWRPDPDRRIRHEDRGRYAREFRELFFQAVRSRLPAGGPVGFTLSGGLDSSAIVSVATQIARSERPGLRLKTYSFRSRRAVDESPYIEMVLGRYPEIEHRYFYFEDCDPTRDLAGQVWAAESPFCDMMDAYFFLLYGKMREEGVRTSLVGEWGDQVLTGSAYLLDLLRQGSLWDCWRELRLLPKNEGGTWEEILKKNFWYLLLPGRIQDRYEGLRRIFWRCAWPSGRWEEEGPRFPLASQRELYDGVFGTLNQMLLEGLDRATAARGMDVRMPFLDRRLTEFLLAIPPREKIRDGLGKRVLREALADVLPEGIACRNTKGDFTELLEERYRAHGFEGNTLLSLERAWMRRTTAVWRKQWIESASENTKSRGSRLMETCAT